MQEEELRRLELLQVGWRLRRRLMLQMLQMLVRCGAASASAAAAATAAVAPLFGLSLSLSFISALSSSALASLQTSGVRVSLVAVCCSRRGRHSRASNSRLP